ncbi:MAG: hypothetical protein ACRDZ7_05965 [Acidimicrobiia bacterium]
MRRRTGLSVIGAGVLLVGVALVGIVGSGAIGPAMLATFTALPAGALLVLAGLDLLSRARVRWAAVSMDDWLATAQSRRYAAKAATN